MDSPDIFVISVEGGGVASSRPPFRTVLAVSFSSVAFYYVEECSLSSTCSRTFIMKACLMLSEDF